MSDHYIEIMTTRVGTHLDRYEIDAELGRGAMGVVYRARDLKLDRTVAIKTVSISGLEPNAEREYRARFVVEAQAAGRLSHPGIVTIFDVREEAEPYLVMEYVEGQSLQQLVSRENRTLPLNITLRLIQEIAEALHYAHSQGVVHRDIKPANILVTTDGHPKITDFGIAKLNQTDLTLPGQVLGSPAYMAPEQLNDEGVDGRSDLFSLGVILYSMLTGHRPFQGNSATTVCFKLVNHDPLAVTTFDTKFPPEIDRIASRAIAKDPDQRYQTGMEMASDIRQLRESCGLIATTGSITDSAAELKDRQGAQPRRSWIKWNGLLPTALLATAIGFVIFAAIQSPHPKTNQAAKTEPALEPTTNGGGNDSGSDKRISVPLAPMNGTLQIEIHHRFANARAWIWLDNRLVYTHSLLGDNKTRALVFRRVEGRQFETIGVPTGKHKVRVRIQSVANHYDQSKTIADAFIRNESTLRIVFGKKSDQLQLTLQQRSE